jgi:hypothetical protein
MPDERATQYTPKGLEIPIPNRATVDDALAKIVQPEKKASGKRKRSPRKK